MKKLVVSSFYNALIDREEAIPLSTMLEIERIRKLGNIFAVSTNNLYTDVLSYNRDFPFLDYIISLNGTYIYDVKKEKCLLKKKLLDSTVKKIINSYPGKKMHFYTANKMFSTLPVEDIYKVEIEFSKKLDLSKLEELNVNISTFKYNNKKYLEITSASVDNLTAVKKLASTNKISLDNTVVVGANEADLSLIENIKDNYIMKNASPVLKKASTKKTNTNESKGVEKVLKKI